MWHRGCCLWPQLGVTAILSWFDLCGDLNKSSVYDGHNNWPLKLCYQSVPAMVRDTAGSVMTPLCCRDLYAFDALISSQHQLLPPSTFNLLHSLWPVFSLPFVVDFALWKNNESKGREEIVVMLPNTTQKENCTEATKEEIHKLCAGK